MFSSANSLIIKHLAARSCTLASAARHTSPFCKHASQPSMGGKRASVLRCPTAHPPPSLSGEAKHIFWSQFWLPARGPVGEEGWLTLPSCCPPWIRRFRWASSLLSAGGAPQPPPTPQLFIISPCQGLTREGRHETRVRAEYLASLPSTFLTP